MENTKIDDYLRMFHMKHQQANYDPKLPKDIADNVVDDSYNFIVEFKKGKGTNWSMADVRDAIDDRIDEMFNDLDECDQFTLQMSDRAPEHATPWNVMEQNK